MDEKQRLYAPPTLPALTAYVSVAVVLFFAGLYLGMLSEVNDIKADMQQLHEENVALRQDLKLMSRLSIPRPERPAPELGGVNAAAAPAAPVSLTAPELRRPATQPAVTRPKRQPRPKREVALSPRSEGGPLAAGDIALSRAPNRAQQKPIPSPAKTPVKRSRDVLPRPAAPSPKPTRAPKAIEKTAPVVKAPPAAPAQAPLDAVGPSGEILATNPDQRRVIISVGRATGVEQGRRFNVYRDGVWAADIRVAQVFSDMSMCDIVTPTSRGIRLGDLVKVAQARTDTGPAGATP